MVNYCQSCRRHLNGAFSCPGCGAAGVAAPEAQDSRSTAWTTEVAWPERDPLPALENHAAAAAAGVAERAHRDVVPAGIHSAARAKDPAGTEAGNFQVRAHAGEGSHALPRPPLQIDKSDEREPAHSGKAVADLPHGRRSRRLRKHRGLGLGVTLTGGFAGIAVIGLLVLGNLPTVGNDGTPVGAVATETTSAPQNPGAISTSGAQALTVTSGGSRPTLTTGGSRPTASANASTISPSSSASKAAIQSAAAAQAQASNAVRPSTVSPSTQAEPSATQSTTPPPPSAPSPSPSQTHVECLLIICW